ncbi:MAG: response regulator [bacterium]
MPKILIFEDDRMLRSMYETKFTMEGFTVVGNDHPTEDPVGLIIKENPAIIISGVVMPVMSGFDAAKLYKTDQRTKGIPLIFLTNLGQSKDVEMGKELGAAAYLIKANHMPIEIVNEVRRVLRLPIPPEKPIPPPGDAWHGPSVGDLPPDKPKSWWQKLFGPK